MTFTRIYLGEPRLKGIPRVPPCDDPVTEVKVWYSEDLESVEADLGPNGTDSGLALPSYTSVDPPGGYYWNNIGAGTQTPIPFSPISVLGSDNNNRFSSSNPHSGTRHLRISGTTGGGTVLGTETHFSTHIPCVSYRQPQGTLQPFHTRPVTARTEGGELVSYSAWLYHGTGGTPAWRFHTTAFDANDETANYSTLWTNTQSFQSIATGSWVNVTHSFTAPAGDAWVTTSLVQRLTLGAGVTYSFDLDDIMVTTS